MNLKPALGLLVIAGVVPAGAAHAQQQQIEVPVLVMEAPETSEVGPVDTELNLANLVQTAAKGVTTVQEAPAIITIIPSDEIIDRGARTLQDVIDTVPGWMRYGAEYGQFPSLSTRGQFQAMLLLRDGVSMFDSMVNIATVGRMQPLETIKRLEIVTGPGGVLWGANSFLGVVNVITKDADDVNGIEASAGSGTGRGNENDFRAYLMAGLPHLFHDSAKLFVHASFESYKGAILTMPQHLFGSPTPNPNGAALYGPIVDSDPAQSTIFNFDGKLTSGPFSLYWSIPWAREYYSMSFPGGVVRDSLPEDTLANPDGSPACSPVAPTDPTAGNPNDMCIDRGRAARHDELDFYERYGIAEYKTRFSDNKAGLTAKGYFIQFVRQFKPLNILEPIPQLLEGGLAFDADLTNYRAGATFDGDVQLSNNVRLIYGAEAFHEWLPDTTVGSRQGAGVEATFVSPYNLNVLPLGCPRTASWNSATMDVQDVAFVPGCPVTFAFAASRTVLGAFADVQWRATPRLILDAGIRGQVAPTAFGTRGYDPQPLGSAAIVYEFIPDWHVKLNFTQGFRPPVWNNTDSNPQAVELAGRPDLDVETSTALQTEINARLLKGRRRIRELDLRADFSQTRLDNYIFVGNGRYTNGKPRGITSAELLAKLYLKGDHRLELGYTWLHTTTADKGAFRSVPEHWFNVGAVISLVPRTLELSTTVRVWGAFEDPNLRVDARDLMFAPGTGWATPGDPGQVIAVQPTEAVLDRIPPAAELEVGIRYRALKDRLTVQATTYNTLNARHYYPDEFQDFEPRNEYLPNPYEDFRFFGSITYAY
jgi:outer membrane receptor protein involved in Fe transport